MGVNKMDAEHCGATLVYGYNTPSEMSMVEDDITHLHGIASKAKKKLYVIGGVHGYDPSGVPTGQTAVEKLDEGAALDEGEADVVVLGGRKVSSFALQDQAVKRLNRSINFTYKSIGKWTTNGSDVKPDKLVELVQTIKRLDESGDWYVLLTWCFSRTWAMSTGIK